VDRVFENKNRLVIIIRLLFCKPKPYAYHSFYRNYKSANQAKKGVEMRANRRHRGDMRQGVKVKQNIRVGFTKGYVTGAFLRIRTLKMFTNFMFSITHLN